MVWHTSSLVFNALRGDARDAFGELVRGSESKTVDWIKVMNDIFSPGGGQVFMTRDGTDYVLEMRYKRYEGFYNHGEGFGSVKIRAANEDFIKAETERAREICGRYRFDPAREVAAMLNLCSVGMVE